MDAQRRRACSIVRRWLPAAVAVLSLTAAMLTVADAAVAGGKLLVYTGNNAVNEGYSQFAAAAGRTQVTSAIFPADATDFDQYQCVVLPVTRLPFSASQKTALTDYMVRGGTVVALAEHLGAPGGVGTAATATFNALASGLGIQALNTTATDSPWTTTGVLPSPYTAGVTTIGYAATTTLTVTAPAVPLVRTAQVTGTDPPPAPFLAIRELGAGKFAYSGDSNLFSDGSGGFYAGTDNGRLANNICGDLSPPVITITTPADGARYRKDQVVPSAWTCVDRDSDVATRNFTNGAVSGTTSGVPIDTTVAAGQTVTKAFSVACADNAGNVAPTQTHHYVVDDGRPVVVIDTPVGGGTYDRNSAALIDWHCEDPSGPSDIDTAPDKTFGTAPSGSPLDTTLPLGGAPIQKSFSATCTDRAGNTDSKTVQYTVADQNPPVAAINSPADGARFTVGKAPVVAGWTCTDPDGPQDIDPDENKTFGSFPVGSQIDTSGAPGQTIQKSFSVLCTDLAGNTGTKSVTYFVDGNPPVVTIAVPIDGGTYQRGSSQPANWACTDPDGDGDIKAKVATVPVGTAINTSTLGVKSFTVTCTDQAGNVGTKTVSYAVVGVPPTATISSPVDGKTYESGAVIPPTYSCADADGDLKSCVRQGGTGAIDTSKGGTFAFTVNAEDLAGNKATKTVHYTVKAKAGTTPGTSVAPSSTTKKVCTSRRQFKIRVKKLKGGVHAVSATVFVNGKKTLTRKGKRVTATVTLKGLKKGQYKVKINVKYSNGKVLSYTRKFKTCTPKGK